jgi:hypothetical protein
MRRTSGGGINNTPGGGNRVYNDYFPSSDEDYYDNEPRYLRVLGPLGLLVIPSHDRSDPEALQNRIRIYSLGVIGTSIFFWCWALLNTFYHLRKNGGLDLGIFSFFGSGFSSVLLLRSSLGGKMYDSNQRCGCFGTRQDADDNTDDLYLGNSRKSAENNSNNTKHSPPGYILRIFVVATQVVVVCNYLLGLLFACTAGKQVYVYFATYCSIFAVLWLVVSYVGFALVKVYREALVNTYGEEALNEGKNSSVGRGGSSLVRRLLLMLVNRQQTTSSSASRNYYEEEDEIDQELLALCENNGNKYSNNTS